MYKVSSRELNSDMTGKTKWMILILKVSSVEPFLKKKIGIVFQEQNLCMDHLVRPSVCQRGGSLITDFFSLTHILAYILTIMGPPSRHICTMVSHLHVFWTLYVFRKRSHKPTKLTIFYVSPSDPKTKGNFRKIRGKCRMKMLSGLPIHCYFCHDIRTNCEIVVWTNVNATKSIAQL